MDTYIYYIFIVYLLTEFTLTSANENGQTNKQLKRIVRRDGSPVVWSSDWSVDLRVEFVSRHPITMQFNCFVFNFDKTTEKLSICFTLMKNNVLITDCIFVPKSGNSTVYLLNSAEVLISFNSKSGLTASLYKVGLEKELPLVAVHCNEETNKGFFTSQQIFILDFRNYIFPKEVWRPETSPELKLDDMSIVKCLQSDDTFSRIDAKLKSWGAKLRQPAIPLNYEWFFCSHDNEKSCHSSKVPFRQVTDSTEFWSSAVLQNGNLFINNLPQAIGNSLKGKRLMCYSMNQLVAFYGSPVKIVGSPKLSDFSVYAPPGPTEIMAYNVMNYSLKISCAYRAQKDFDLNRYFVFDALRAERALPLQKGSDYRQYNLELSEDGFQAKYFAPFFEISQGAMLACVSYTRLTMVRKLPKNLNHIYKLFYKSSPKFEETIPHVVHLSFCGFDKLQCRFTDFRSTTPSMALRGVELNLTSMQSVNESMAYINGKYKAVLLAPHNFTVNVDDIKKGQHLQFIPWTRYIKEDSHYMTCIGRNDPFITRQNILLKSTFKIWSSRIRRCNYFCLVRCTVDKQLMSNGRTEFSVEWFAQNDADPSSDGTSIGFGETITYNMSQVLGGYLKCTIRLKNPDCGGEFARKSKVFKVQFFASHAVPLWTILSIIILIYFTIMTCNCVRYFYCVKREPGQTRIWTY